MRLGRVRRVHFIGIGGSGMSGIAEVLLDLGYRVTGTDSGSSEALERLEELGAQVHRGHDAARVHGADVVVASSAVPADNPERLEAERLRIPCIPRAEMLGELMRMKYAVAVAGSHGKTSTTSMIATVLSHAGLDPTVVIGGRLASLGGHGKLGRSDVFVAEADESDGSFLKLYPTLAVVTGIDREHIDHYGSLQALHDTFLAFTSKVPFYGATIACLDDPGVQEILPRIERRVVTYGLSAQAEIRAVEIVAQGFQIAFGLRRGGETVARVTLDTPGEHQVHNALAALAVAHELGLNLRVAAAALDGFPGADRRMQRLGEFGGVLVVDDYGHHPTEIRATLKALRSAIGERRLVVLFQPHRVSRTAALMEEFARSFHEADAVYITDIYNAGEADRPGVDARALAGRLSERGHRDVRYAGPLDEALEQALAGVRAGDVLLTLGAGSIAGAARRAAERLADGGGGR